MSLIEGIKPDGKADAVALTDDNAFKVALVAGGVGDGLATATKQDEQIAVTNIANGWFPSQSKRYTSVGAGIDLTTAVPGKTAIGIMGSRTATNGSVLQAEFVGNAGGELIELNFGPGYLHYGQWKKIDSTTTAGCFPLFVLFV